MKFKYLKGSEKDFEGVEDGFLLKVGFNPSGFQLFKNGCYTIIGEELLVVNNIDGGGSSAYSIPRQVSIIAQREPIAEPEKLGHGLDCEECKPINTGDCVIMDGKRYIVGEVSIPCVNINIRNNSGEPVQIEKSENDGDTIIQNIISEIKKPGDDYRKLVQSINKSRLKDKSALTVTITAEEMRPTIQKLIDDFTSQPIELSLQIVNGRPVISDQFGRVVKNYATVNYNSDKDISAQAAISVKFKETK